jgi:alkylation response protein AidB-like acyl-CoA dehydrogenase
LLMSATDQLLLTTAMEMLGPAASLGEAAWYNRYLRSRATTILGGTAQIQRNILATRVLGLGR